MATDIGEFTGRWSQADGSERQNYQLFLTELCQALELPRPDPASKDNERNSYVFERTVDFQEADGTSSKGFIDLYKRGSFVLEAKQTGLTLGSQPQRAALLKAHGQAQRYARALPAEEGRPPFLITCDVGRSLDIYSEFTRSGATYVPFPDPRSHRIRLEDLADEEAQATLRAIWTDPMSLDPARRSAKVTREIAAELAKLAETLEGSGRDADTVASFLMRCLFTMFAEDVGLLPKRSFFGLLEDAQKNPQQFQPLVTGLWKIMDRGGFSPEVRSDLLRFNGGLFREHEALALDANQIKILLRAAKSDWRYVEPAIFGTLLERALDPDERHKLGAHYTPRAYVERLVMPTIIEPLRDEWTSIQAAALQLENQGRGKDAIAEVEGFLTRLSKVRVLDPACGSGNFLYVTLEHLKRLEGEVYNTLEELGAVQYRLETQGVSVDPHQMLGLEKNPRAARIAEAVLWIGYLQWHFRTRGDVSPPEPVLKDYKNIEQRDAVLAWDRIEYELGEDGRPKTRWDGKTYKKHPATGELVPDESAQAPVERYVNPRRAEWPQAEFVVGNPPYLGARRVRAAVGSGYLSALRDVYDDVPEHVDYVMYWWDIAADRARSGAIRRFGLITTNSIRQSFSRKVLDEYLQDDRNPVSICFAIPDHPWVDSEDGAAVRVALTVGCKGNSIGRICEVLSERPGDDGEVLVTLRDRWGSVSSGLRVGARVGAAVELQANSGMSCVGYQLTGKGFVVEDASWSASDRLVKPLLSGRDITQRSRGLSCIDAFGLSEPELMREHPDAWQWIYNRVKPERDHNNRAALRRNWWIFGEARSTFRPALTDLEEAIATSLTAKQRTFTLVAASTVCDSTTVVFSLEVSFLGVLSSRAHVAWALASGGTLEDRPRYNKTRCFETFPFPTLNPDQRDRIGELGEAIDRHRKQRQALHPDLTITGMYNVLESLRQGAALSDKEREIHEQGLVAVLGQLHDELDRAVFEAYGWADLADALVGKPGGTTPYRTSSREQEEAEEELLTRLVQLNAERAQEESRGLVRWLRPEYQNPGGAKGSQGSLMDGVGEAVEAPRGRAVWPKKLSEQMQAVRAALGEQPGPATAEQVARGFKRAKTRLVAEMLEVLESLGQVRRTESGGFVAG